MEIERTLVLIKPDGVRRTLAGNIISRFENAGLKIVGMKMQWVDENFAKQHYSEEISKKHGEKVWKSLIKYITEGPVIALVLEGIDAINVVRKITGNTYPNEALPGTIRGDFAHISRDYANAEELKVKNLIHASANKDDAKIEIPLWFKDDELHSYKTIHDFILNI